MEVVYRALSAIPDLCIKFHGITTLNLGMPMMDGLFLVFELASGGSIDNYLEQPEVGDWNEVIGLFADISYGLWDGLHMKGIAHGFASYYGQSDSKRFASRECLNHYTVL